MLEAIRTDSLHTLEKQIKREAERSILTAAKLIAPVIEDNFTAGKWNLSDEINKVLILIF